MRYEVAGSHRTPLPGASRGAPVEPGEETSVTVMLRRRSGRPQGRVSRAEFASTLGADPADVSAVESFAAAHGLRVEDVDRSARTVKIAGTLGALQQAFGVELFSYHTDGGSYRGREGSITVPSELGPVVTGVFGLDDRPQLRPHVRVRAEAAGTTYTAPEVARLYDFPKDLDGEGECVAIVEFGGGYLTSDLSAYFKALGLATPAVVSVGVDGGKNSPGSAQRQNDADGEVALDIQVAGAVAPKAKVAVYFAPNTDQGFVDAITKAVHDTTNQPSVLSISWGAPENLWSQQTQQAMDEAFTDAAALGVTVYAAAGDHGSADQDTSAGSGDDGQARVDFPASSPNVIGCGGTRLEGSGGTITSETVWNDGDGWATGGGVSDSFDLPSWQESANVPASANGDGRRGRGVPDVSGNADSVTGYRVRLYGQEVAIGGTSAVAPLWAGLQALLNQAAGKPLGLITPQLYAYPNTLRDVTSGSNAVASTPGYDAGEGWDACTGLGSPDGSALRELFTRPE